MKNFPRETLHSSGAPLLLDPTRLLLSFQSALAQGEIAALLASLDLVLEDGGDKERPAVSGEMVNH